MTFFWLSFFCLLFSIPNLCFVVWIKISFILIMSNIPFRRKKPVQERSWNEKLGQTSPTSCTRVWKLIHEDRLLLFNSHRKQYPHPSRNRVREVASLVDFDRLLQFPREEVCDRLKRHFARRFRNSFHSRSKALRWATALVDALYAYTTSNSSSKGSETFACDFAEGGAEAEDGDVCFGCDTICMAK
jgi:hypothetical protein